MSWLYHRRVLCRRRWRQHGGPPALPHLGQKRGRNATCVRSGWAVERWRKWGLLSCGSSFSKKSFEQITTHSPWPHHRLCRTFGRRHVLLANCRMFRGHYWAGTWETTEQLSETLSAHSPGPLCGRPRKHMFLWIRSQRRHYW
jgi:hypothetical protein